MHLPVEQNPDRVLKIKVWRILDARFIKRVFDVAASVLGVLFLCPFFALIAILIVSDSPGGIFYYQPRLGAGGKIFRLIKFRTMCQAPDQMLEEKLRLQPALKSEWSRYQKLKSDPRVTRIGRFLRRFSLDELPQLWNVMKGEMSLVGPRPILIQQRRIYGQAYNEYVQVFPGITGLWQVSGRNETTFARRVELDREYIQRWSLRLDIYILFKTFKTIFRQQGAY
jgi:lipopolysaccharide/colanic/teichoic acid biosynthesis glycosyltransferase